MKIIGLLISLLYENKYWKLNEEYNIDKMLYLLIDRPDLIDICHIFIWENIKGNIHRNYDLPAYVINSVIWYKNGDVHRNNDKPAIIYATARKSYYIKNKLYEMFDKK